MSDEQQIDKRLTCRDCGADFTWSAGEQEWFHARNLTEPRRCRECRIAKRMQRDGLGNLPHPWA